MSPIFIPDVRAAAGRLSMSRRWHPADTGTHTALARELATARVANYAAEIMQDSPALTADQITVITAILSGAEVV